MLCGPRRAGFQTHAGRGGPAYGSEKCYFAKGSLAECHFLIAHFYSSTIAVIFFHDTGFVFLFEYINGKMAYSGETSTSDNFFSIRLECILDGPFESIHT